MKRAQELFTQEHDNMRSNVRRPNGSQLTPSIFQIPYGLSVKINIIA